jgi:hypothetical protein
MDIFDVFFQRYSYKFPKGYPDMNNADDVLLLENLLKKLGINLDEQKKSYKQIIDTILASPEANGKLGPHSRSKRIKNIGNISNNEFIKIISNIFDIDTSEIKVIPPKAEGSESSKNFTFKFPLEGQETTIVLGTESQGKEIETYELNNLNNFIKENGGSINIKLGDNLYKNITQVVSVPGNKQADFIFKGEPDLFIQHKDLKASQQLSGVKKLESDPEVQQFVQDVKDKTNGVLTSGNSFKREVKSEDLQLKGAYGIGDNFGIDKVQSIIYGNIKLTPSPDNAFFELSGPIQFNYPELLTGDYKPYMYATYRGYGINQQGVKNARFGFYPKKYYPSARDI